MIAEPWDLGNGGYQVGNFPVLWTEWNGRYRDAIRGFWNGKVPISRYFEPSAQLKFPRELPLPNSLLVSVEVAISTTPKAVARLLPPSTLLHVTMVLLFTISLLITISITKLTEKIIVMVVIIISHGIVVPRA